MPLVSPPGAFLVLPTVATKKERQSCFCSANTQPVASHIQTTKHSILLASPNVVVQCNLLHLDARTSEKLYKCDIKLLLIQCNLREIASSHGLKHGVEVDSHLLILR